MSCFFVNLGFYYSLQVGYYNWRGRAYAGLSIVLEGCGEGGFG